MGLAGVEVPRAVGMEFGFVPLDFRRKGKVLTVGLPDPEEIDKLAIRDALREAGVNCVVRLVRVKEVLFGPIFRETYGLPKPVDDEPRPRRRTKKKLK
jgi:hypothetical protein